MARSPEPAPESTPGRWVRPALILSGALLGLAVAWLFSLVSGISLPLWEALAALLLGALLGFSASLPTPPRPSARR
ncbi:MAG: hypothetical protein J7452_07830 [Thermoflexus sp.]|jgi:purine-cytosine permease-like protein|nr:hypothetical protein [Thermoflexus sp.]